MRDKNYQNLHSGGQTLAGFSLAGIVVLSTWIVDLKEDAIEVCLSKQCT